MPAIGKARIVVVGGDVCSGSSTLARALAEKLDCDLFDLGQEFRREVTVNPQCDTGEISIALNGLSREYITSARKRVVEGRLVGLQSQGHHDIAKLLCTAPDEVLARRYMERERLPGINVAVDALRRRQEQDDMLLRLVWGVSRAQAFDPGLYDIVIDTSTMTAREIVGTLIGMENGGR